MIRIDISESRYLEVKSVKNAAEPHSTGQGGTDIHVTKVAPGSEFGQGYIVEIFDYGQKVDERFVQTKKQVMELVKEQKARYNTNKAFEEELKLHVTFKSPGGQGFKHQGSEQGVESMNIDQILFSKAAKINNLVATLEDPKISRKSKRALDPMVNSTTPSKAPSLNLDNSGTEINTQDELVEYVKNELVEYFSSPESQSYEPGQNPENIISKYLSDIRHIIEREDPNQEIFNLNDAAEKIKAIFKDSGLPGEGILFKAASFEDDILVSKINTEIDNPGEVKETLTNTENLDEIVENISKRENKNQSETLLSKLSSQEYLSNLEDMFRYAADDFWMYLKKYKGINTLNNVYSEWHSRVNPLVINSELNPLLKAYIFDNVESYFSQSNSKEKYKKAFDSVISSYKKATTIIINESTSEDTEKISTEIPAEEQEQKEPIFDNGEEQDTFSAQPGNLGESPLVESPTSKTLLDTLKSQD
jgi:hypothetical protein